jgi:hypothetical protein
MLAQQIDVLWFNNLNAEMRFDTRPHRPRSTFRQWADQVSLHQFKHRVRFPLQFDSIAFAGPLIEDAARSASRPF